MQRGKCLSTAPHLFGVSDRAQQCCYTNLTNFKQYRSEDDTLIHTTASNISRRDNDYFDGWVTAVADDDEDSFSCTILFDGLPFNLTANVLSGDSTRNVPFSWALILITLYSLV